MDMSINGFDIHAVVPVLRRGKPDTYYIAGLRADQSEAVCAWTYDLFATSWSQGCYFPVGNPGIPDGDAALRAVIQEAYERAGVVSELAASLLSWWEGLDEDERALTGVGASND